MKKFIAFVILVLGTIRGVTGAYAGDVHTIKLNVDSVAYSLVGDTYYGYTEKLADGTKWVFAVNPRKGEDIEDMRSRVVGKPVIITYNEVGDDVEVLFTSLD